MSNGIINLLIMLVVFVLLGVPSEVIFAKGGGKSSMISLDLNIEKEKADVILTARLIPAPLPYEVLGKKFYQIVPDDIINGILAENSFLVVITNVLSSEGKPAEIETDVSYMLLLRKIDLSLEGLPDELTAYSLVGNWKGIISLDKNAVERRAVRKIEKQYGIPLNGTPQEALKKVKALLDFSEAR